MQSLASIDKAICKHYNKHFSLGTPKETRAYYVEFYSGVGSIKRKRRPTWVGRKRE